MKKILILLPLLVAVQLVHAQKIKTAAVPENVRNMLRFNFPQTQDSVKHPVKWEKVNGMYKGTLSVMDAPATVLIDTTGKVRRIEKTIHESYLPDNIKTFVNTNYKNGQIKSAVKVTDDAGKNTFNLTIESKAIFDEEGNPLKAAK